MVSDAGRSTRQSTTPDEADQGTMLLTAEEALASAASRAGHTSDEEGGDNVQKEEQIDADSVFASLKSLKRDDNDDDN